MTVAADPWTVRAADYTRQPVEDIEHPGPKPGAEPDRGFPAAGQGRACDARTDSRYARVQAKSWPCPLTESGQRLLQQALFSGGMGQGSGLHGQTEQAVSVAAPGTVLWPGPRAGETQCCF